MQYRNCTSCGKRLPWTAEFFHRLGKGLHPSCKDCRNAKQRAVNDTPEMKRFVRERNRRPEIRAYQSRYYKTDKALAKLRQYREENPEKTYAWKMVELAIKDGRLPHPRELECAHKGEYCLGQAMDYHHSDYSEPLDVIPVCRSCHKLIHLGEQA